MVAVAVPTGSLSAQQGVWMLDYKPEAGVE